MGEAKRKRQQKQRSTWPHEDSFRGAINLYFLPPVAAINGARLRELTGDDQIPDTADKPVGVNRCSSLHLTHLLAKDFDGVIHWARDTETFQSILKSYRAARSGRQGKRLAQFRNCDTLST
jgi:hypothetical protein